MVEVAVDHGGAVDDEETFIPATTAEAEAGKVRARRMGNARLGNGGPCHRVLPFYKVQSTVVLTPHCDDGVPTTVAAVAVTNRHTRNHLPNHRRLLPQSLLLALLSSIPSRNRLRHHPHPSLPKRPV